MNIVLLPVRLSGVLLSGVSLFFCSALAIAQHPSSPPTYHDIKQELKTITHQKNLIVDQYLPSSRDLQLAYQKYVSPEQAREAAIEVKLLKQVAPVAVIVEIDSLNERYQQLTAMLKVTPDEDGVYDAVDELPRPKPGMKAFYESIAKQLRYPESARKKRVQGKVYVQFVVDEYGTILQPEVLKGLGHGCDKEVVRVLGKAEHWVPGRTDGHAVRTRMMLPISFRLEKGTVKSALEDFVVTNTDKAESYEEIKQSLRKIKRLKAEIMRKYYTSSRDLQLAFKAQTESSTDNGKSADVNLLNGVLSAQEVARLEQLSHLRVRLEQKLKQYPNADGVFEIVDEAARPVEGNEKFYARLAQRLRYPATAVKKGIEGKVYVRLIIDERGKIANSKVIKGIDLECDYEAVRVLELMPRWQPALIDGKAVKSKAIVPIVFQLGKR